MGNRINEVRIVFVTLLLVSFMLVSSCGGAKDSPDEPQYRLSKLEIVSQSTGHTDIRQFYYDDSGHLLRREEDKSGDGSVDSIWSYLHENGQMTELLVDSDNDGETNNRLIYLYTNEKLDRMTFKNINTGELGTSQVMNYDGNNVTSMDLVDKVGNVTRTFSYKYNMDGLMISEDYGDGSITEQDYIFDQQGRLFSIEIKFNSSDNSPGVIAYTYFEQGPCIVPEVKSFNRYHCSNK
ncbi:MAG: hypothetical protein OEY52_10525 [Gammaproteobacteria bacterium]|nr:hypothetical protein [Gammaproteobacteria bacterium]